MKHFQTIPIVLAGTMLLFSASKTMADPARTTLWRPYLEWQLENPAWEGNPFDVAATATFTLQAKAPVKFAVTTNLFYDGGTTWRFRFTGTRIGTWTWTTQSDDPDLNGHSGEVVITPNPDKQAHGFVIAMGSKWAWQGSGRAFVPQLIMASNEPEDWIDARGMDRFLRVFLDGHGFNGIHVPTISGRWFDINAKNLSTSAKLVNPDPRTFRALERLLVQVHAKGGFTHIWAWGDHQRHQTPLTLKGGPQGEVDKRLQRYMAARLGPIPGWTMGYGFDLQEWAGQPGRVNLVAPWRNYMQSHMGWPHILGGRMGPTIKDGSTDHRKQARLNQGLDYFGYEHHRPTYAMYRAAFKASGDNPVFSEDRFRVRVPPRYPDKDYNEVLTRRGLYHSALAGGAANIWGTNVPGGWAGGFASKPYQHVHWIKTYARFMNHRFLNDMAPADGITQGPCLKSVAHNCYIIYKEDADAVSLDFSHLEKPLPAVAVDTKKPYAEIKLDRIRPARQTWRAPYRSDWAIAVGEFE